MASVAKVEKRITSIFLIFQLRHTKNLLNLKGNSSNYEENGDVKRYLFASVTKDHVDIASINLCISLFVFWSIKWYRIRSWSLIDLKGHLPSVKLKHSLYILLRWLRLLLPGICLMRYKDLIRSILWTLTKSFEPVINFLIIPLKISSHIVKINKICLLPLPSNIFHFLGFDLDIFWINYQVCALLK